MKAQEYGKTNVGSRLISLQDGDRVVGKVSSLVLGRRPGSVVAAKEALDHNPLRHAVLLRADLDTLCGVDLLAVDVDDNLAVGLAHVVHGDLLRDRLPHTGLPGPLAGTKRPAVSVVARGVGRGAHGRLVLGLGRGREVKIKLASTALAPHHAGREAIVAGVSTGATSSSGLGGSSVETGELAALVEREAFVKENRVGKGEDLGVVDRLAGGSGSVERDTTESLRAVGKGALGERDWLMTSIRANTSTDA